MFTMIYVNCPFKGVVQSKIFPYRYVEVHSLGETSLFTRTKSDTN